MKTKIKELSKTKKKISLDVSEEKVGEAYSKAYHTLRNKVAIKGFRKGKVPDAIIDQHFAGDLERESLQILISRTYEQALDEHQIVPLLPPRFELSQLQKGKPFSYHVEVEVRPEVKLTSYVEIPIEKKEIIIADEEITSELERLREAKAELVPAEAEKRFEKGLVGTLNFEGVIDGKPFKGGSAKDYLLEMGRGVFLKEFEDQLTGMKKGEEKNVTLNFPENYHSEELRNKKAIFKVALVNLHTKQLPASDDEFAKDLGKENLETVKKEIREALSKKKERENRNHSVKEVIDYLLAAHQLEVPQGLIDRQLEKGEAKKEEIENSIRLQFIVEEIAKKESIRVDPKEVEEHFHFLSHQNRQPVAAIKKYFVENHLIDSLIARLGMEKTLDFLVSKAKFKN